MPKPKSYKLLISFIRLFLVISFALRTILLIISFSKLDDSFSNIVTIYAKGFVFDMATALYFCVPYSLYLLLFPQKWSNSIVNKVITYTATALNLLIISFSFFAEFNFWDEFESRLNFIAVDYLIYTYEVVNNINESYPMYLLIPGILVVTSALIWILHKSQAFDDTFKSRTPLKQRFLYTTCIIGLSVTFTVFLSNSWAEKGKNRYQNELSKAGVYSFFAAFKNNELQYDLFYLQEDIPHGFAILRNELKEPATVFSSNENSIYRKIENGGSTQSPNIILVIIESFSASFMSHFGNNDNITPNLDLLANQGIFFTNMYATGTRTIRGMEALALSVPPTPGSSIVRRPNNNNLFNISTILKQKGYHNTFIYGGDGYFDNMNAFFGNNGFDIIDKGRKINTDKLQGARTIIKKDEIEFENAWGISDEDLYSAAIRNADKKHDEQQAFFELIMTTSNHRPYTYPEGKIDIPSASGRNGAVKYMDYAVGEFIENIKSKPWFDNTIVVFIADHCANSAGKNEIEVSKYKIPCIIYNLPKDAPKTIDKQCSQIDLFPTLFSLLNWDYHSNFFGKNILSDSYIPHAFIGTYQKLGYLEGENLVIISPQQVSEMFHYNEKSGEMSPAPVDKALLSKTIAYYQSAYYMFKNGGMKEDALH